MDVLVGGYISNTCGKVCQDPKGLRIPFACLPCAVCLLSFKVFKMFSLGHPAVFDVPDSGHKGLLPESLPSIICPKLQNQFRKTTQKLMT